MPRKKPDKKIPRLESDFQDILVCRDAKLHPYMEIFVQEAENITQENLGTLLGVLEITDISEDSSYIVNYLISVIKKEYFSRSKRDAVESFEAAMRKANLALSKLAEHGNLNWIGHLNAICAVIERDNIHFSPAGTVRALLIRSKSLTDISEGGEEPVEPNPLKTFVDVLSGKIESGDKLIISTQNIFDIFSPDEIKRSALKFSQENFIQFLNTALVNELERAAVLVADITKRKEALAPINSPRSTDISAFSQKAFEKNIARDTASEEEKKKMIQELKEELQKTQGDFVDKKTGHIYIKDMGELKEKFSLLNYLKTNLFFPANPLARFRNRSESQPDSFTPDIESSDKSVANNLPPRQRSGTLRKILNKKINLAPLAVIAHKTIKKIPLKKLFSLSKKSVKLLMEKIKNKRLAVQKIPPSPLSNNSPAYQSRKQTPASKNSRLLAILASGAFYSKAITKKFFRVGLNLTKSLINLLPRFSKLKESFSSLTPKKRLYLGLTVAAIFIVPLILVRWKNKLDREKAQVLPAISINVLPLEQDKNLVRIENLNGAYNASGILNLINLNGKIFTVAIDKIHSPEDNSDYPVLENFKDPQLIFGMDDLNLIFIFKENKILSFSPRSKKFQENSISVPDQAEISYAGSYLTYAYLLDAKNNQIYRYPRAGSGFGEKIDWLKENYDLSQIKTVAINDNIFMSDGKSIIKFYRGRQQDFSLEETATPIFVEKLYAKPGNENLYVLDKTNARIIKLTLDGKIVTQYYNTEISNATDFVVDEENKNVYFTSENGVKSFEIN